MASDDLQQMISDVPYTWTGRKVKRIVPIAGLVGIVIFLSLLIAVIYLGATRCKNKQERTDSSSSNQAMTLTSSQLQSVAYVLSNMNESVDPCEDFYKYSCGGWMDRKVLAPTQYRISVVGDMIEDYEENWRTILDSPISDRSQSSAERKLKEFYSLCLEQYGRMKEGGQGLVSVINDYMKGWYVLDQNIWQKQWNLENALITAQGQLRVTNAYFRFEVTRNQDVENLDTPMIRVGT